MKRIQRKILGPVFVLAPLIVLQCLAICNIVDSPITAPAAGASSQTTMSINPQNSFCQIGQTFRIEINIANVTDLLSYRIELTYDTNLVAYVDHWNGSWIKPPKGTLAYVKGVKDNRVILVLNKDVETKPVSGSGTLMIVEFRGIDIGNAHFAVDDGETWLHNAASETIHFEGPISSYCSVGLHPTIKLWEDYTLLKDISFSDLDCIFIFMADNITLDLNGHTIHNKGYLNANDSLGHGIEIMNHNNITVKGGTIAGFQYGIQVFNSNNVTISNVTILNTKDYAIEIKELSSRVRIWNSSLSNNKAECLSLTNCSLSEISNNTFSKNDVCAIDMKFSDNNTISHNRIIDNRNTAIKMIDCCDNTIFNNDFINNTNAPNGPQVSLTSSYKTWLPNNWNLGYPGGGNFWDNAINRSIVDQKAGPNLKIAGPDGIGDTPYVITTEYGPNQDNYPLMNPCTCARTGLLVCDTVLQSERRGIVKREILSVAVFTNASCTDFNFSVGTDEQEGTVGSMSISITNATHCKVIFAKELFNGVFEVVMDGNPVASFVNWDGDYVFIDMDCSAGSHEVRILANIIRQYDLNGDGTVNIVDLGMLASIGFGTTYTYEAIG